MQKFGLIQRSFCGDNIYHESLMSWQQEAGSLLHLHVPLQAQEAGGAQSIHLEPELVGVRAQKRACYSDSINIDAGAAESSCLLIAGGGPVPPGSLAEILPPRRWQLM